MGKKWNPYRFVISACLSVRIALFVYPTISTASTLANMIPKYVRCQNSAAIFFIRISPVDMANIMYSNASSAKQGVYYLEVEYRLRGIKNKADRQVRQIERWTLAT